MTKQVKVAIISGAAAVIAAAIPVMHFWPRRSVVAGRIIDAKTKSGIDGAILTVTGMPGTYASSHSGNFYLPISDSGGRDQIRLRVEKDGYQIWDDSLVIPSADNVVQLAAINSPTTFSSTFNFKQPALALSASSGPVSRFDYGFSSLESDSSVRGTDIRVRTVRLEIKVRTHSTYTSFDAWVLLGPGPFGLPVGSIHGQDPYNVKVTAIEAPTQVRFVMGSGGATYPPDTEVTLFATYNLDSGQQGGNILELKECCSAPLDLPSGLFAQVFLWDGNPGVTVEIENIVVRVEGTESALPH
jgi:hypothetical protein